MPDGKICYVELPATDVEVSAEFYSKAFGWESRTRGDGSRAFDDTTGAVSGAWVLGRPAAREAGILVYIMVDSIEASLNKVTAGGGRVETPFTPLGDGGDAFATFSDPAGNLLGLYQEPQR
ncbi:MAG TPA: VOC family protein [Blastocatellia bacterium]|nr:VOC family protein [Blastocatellia bacterium]